MRTTCQVLVVAFLTSCGVDKQSNDAGNTRPDIPSQSLQEDDISRPPPQVEVVSKKQRLVGTWEWQWDGPRLQHTFRADGTMIVTVGDFSRSEGSWEYVREEKDTIVIKTFMGDEEAWLRFEGDNRFFFVDGAVWERAEFIDVHPPNPPRIVNATRPGGDGRRERGPNGPEQNSKGGGQRWLVHFTTTSLKEYAQQLDCFNIEIGAVHRSLPKIEYARNLSKEKPDRRAGNREGERGRVWHNWPKNSKERKYDVALLERAGIATEKCFIIQFYSAELQTNLLKLELDSVKRQMPKRTIDDVRHTHFEVRKTGATYKLTVKKHDFR
ncbi:MAG: hypothetical protein IH991_04605 [Planctomycetes bacterium]|nr:hypothetical protein [Planctomycetota bacterium]